MHSTSLQTAVSCRVLLTVAVLLHAACVDQTLEEAPGAIGAEEPREPIATFRIDVGLDGATSVSMIGPRAQQIAATGPTALVTMTTLARGYGVAACGDAATFCATVEVASRYHGELRGVTVTLDNVSGGHSASNPDPKPSHLSANSGGAPGLWIYGNLGAQGHPGDRASREWRFTTKGGAVSVTGRIFADLASVGAAVEATCIGGVDDDGDGHADCLDGDCALDPACPAETCGNGKDDDWDGDWDCDDEACAATYGCMEGAPIARVNTAVGGGQANIGAFFSPTRPSVSFDGRLVAFASQGVHVVGDTNGLPDVFLLNRTTGVVKRVSVGPGGAQATLGMSLAPSLSGNRRFVSFMSTAANLVAGDTNGLQDVFVHELLTGVTTRVSVSSSGAQATGGQSTWNVISADGRYVMFRSSATNLVPGDTNGVADIFVHDRATGITTRVSVGSDGTQANEAAEQPAMSSNGRYVAFWSLATNLVAGDTNGVSDIFVHDRVTGTTTRLVAPGGAQLNGASTVMALSADGRYLAFLGQATNLVPGLSLPISVRLYVHDRTTGVTTLESRSSTGTPANAPIVNLDISDDGRHVTFGTSASNLVPGDTNGQNDVFVRDRTLGTTSRVSVNADGLQASGPGAGDPLPVLSGDGRYCAFYSTFGDLVPGDTNGQSDIFIAPVPTP